MVPNASAWGIYIERYNFELNITTQEIFGYTYVPPHLLFGLSLNSTTNKLLLWFLVSAKAPGVHHNPLKIIISLFEVPQSSVNARTILRS